MSVSSSEHRLEGLEPDNLLAFMALLGVLRALETARPDWKPRVSWSLEDGPIRPCLHTATTVAESDIGAALEAGVERLAEDYDFDRDSIDWSAAEARALQVAAESSQWREQLIGALFSDAALMEANVDRTPFCLLGAGRQRFLPRLQAVVNRGSLRRSREGKKRSVIGRSEFLGDALFRKWRRMDDSGSFRWDPEEDRRHALSARAPTDEKPLTEHGANVLAAIGLPSFSGAAAFVSGRVRYCSRGAFYKKRGPVEYFWPVWQPSMSAAGIIALLAHPDLCSPDGDLSRLHRLGVRAVLSARRHQIGKYSCVTYATFHWA